MVMVIVKNILVNFNYALIFLFASAFPYHDLYFVYLTRFLYWESLFPI